MKHRLKLNILITSLALLSLITYIVTTVDKIGHTTFDDAYMISRYAQHWLLGEGFSWNSIDGPAYGITSPAYLVLITAVMSLGISDEMALTITSFTAGVLSVLILVLLGFLVQRSKWSCKFWTPLLIVPVLLLSPPFRYHSLTGMETTLSLLTNSLLACSVVIATKRHSISALVLCLISGLLSYATRPDNGLYALLIPPVFFVITDRSLWRYSILYILLFASGIGCSLIINHLMFGDFLPLPFFAKRAGFYKGYTGVGFGFTMKQMLVFALAALPFILLMISTISKKTLFRALSLGSIIGVMAIYYATITQIMGMQARYYYPSIAFVVLATFTTVFSHEKSGPQQCSRGTAWSCLLVGIAVFSSAWSDKISHMAETQWENRISLTPSELRSTIQPRSPKDTQPPSLGWWKSIKEMRKLLDRMPKGIVFAASEYGFISAKLPDLTIIDLVGLHDRTIAHHGFNSTYVLSREPDLIWLPHSDYTYNIAQILDNPSFRQAYEYYPGAYDYGIALHKNSKFYASMKTIAQEEFSRTYPGLYMPDYVVKQIDAPIAIPIPVASAQP